MRRSDMRTRGVGVVWDAACVQGAQCHVHSVHQGYGCWFNTPEISDGKI